MEEEDDDDEADDGQSGVTKTRSHLVDTDSQSDDLGGEGRWCVMGVWSVQRHSSSQSLGQTSGRQTKTTGGHHLLYGVSNSTWPNN